MFDLIKLKTAVVLPVNLKNLFVRVEPIRRTRHVNMFERRYIRTELKSMSLSNCGVKLWNVLKANLATEVIIMKDIKKILIMNMMAYNTMS